MYAAVSGMKAHMNKLNVIGNNVANVNTFGYKSARATFTESLYTSMRAGSNGSNTMGGINPAQLGYGANISTIDLDMSSKSYVPTGRAMDCAIGGDGFFFVGPKADMNIADPTSTDPATYNVKRPQDLLLTRVGDFKFDPDGYLTDGRGNVVYGFVTCANEADGTAVDTAGPALNKEKYTFTTQLVPIRLPMAAPAPTDLDNDPAEGEAIFPGKDDTTGLNLYPANFTTGKTITVESISIDDTTGMVKGYNTATDSAVVIGYIPLAKVANPYGVTHDSGPYYRAGAGAGDCSVAFVGGVPDGVDPHLATGVTGDAPFISSTGDVVINTGGLEASGTDIATEFAEMISTQRGYQANTRIITVTDAMLEELVNIKR